MTTIYAVDKETNTLRFKSDNIAAILSCIEQTGKTENDFYILEDFNMKYVSRIVYIDDKCVYNNTDFWLSDEPDTISENFEEHTVLDVTGQPIDKLRFDSELISIRNAAAHIDGNAGAIEYNMTVGMELVALLREECINTELEEVTPMMIMAKTKDIVLTLVTGSLREAKTLVDMMEPDEFFTQERIHKYSEMLESADAITYKE